jgi:hypothetical protein
LFLTSEPERFGVINPEHVIQELRACNYPAINYLINQLPLLNRGYSLRQSLHALMQIYSIMNLRANHGMIYPDYYMNSIFGGTIPAIYYMYRPGQDQLRKISMQDAINEGLIDHPLNSYESAGIPNTSNWASHKLYHIVLANSTSFLDLDQETKAYLNDPIIYQELLHEYELINNTFNQLKRVLQTYGGLLTYRNYIAPDVIKEPGDE